MDSIHDESVICQWFYACVVIKELHVDQNITGVDIKYKTYIPVKKTIIKSNVLTSNGPLPG